MPNRLRATVLCSTLALAAMLAAAPAGAASSSDTRIAQQGVIVSTDMPSSWTSTAPDNSGDKQAAKIAAKIKDCKSYALFTKGNDKVPHAESRQFDLGSNGINNKSSVYPTVKLASQAMSAVGDTNVASCLTQVFQQLIDAQYKSNSSVKSAIVKIAPVTNLPSGLGDDAVGYAGGANITLTDGTTQQVIVGLLAARVGRAINAYSFTQIPPADISAAIDGAINATIQRTEAAVK